MILLDTHIFLDLTGRAPVRFREEYESTDIVVSAITAAEIACLQRLERIILTMRADDWFDHAVRAAGVRVLPLTPRLLARSQLMVWDHRDPADRILVQTILDQPGTELHTKEARILGFARDMRLNVRDCRN
jgi:PIN domain nuclease of toxin-antitoxin system